MELSGLQLMYHNLPVDEKVQQLEELTSNTQELKSTEVTASVSILVTATEDVSGNITLTSTFLEVVDNILVVNQEVLEESQKSSNTSAKLLEAIESVAENIPITNSSEPVVIAQTSFAVSIQQVDLDDFEESGQNFSVVINNTSKGNLSSESLSFGKPISSPTASISLPKSLFNAVPHFINNTRITNLVFLSESVFLRRNFSYLKVSSIIVSASVVGAGTIRGIKPPVDLSFQLDPNSNGTNPQCTFWNQSFDGGYGDWSSEGCNTSSNDSQVMCQCDHLTSFAILLDASPIIEPTERTGLTLFLDSITYIGIVISLVCLTITVTTYLSS
uniref:GAIN-B domain-containing protein n=1 Tax=Amphimedon queenslandica TaxID=400682 RepID=A0A1X7SMH6_AMPQE